ncbi:hypothetical protein Misp01_54220 [Microtetraspora sp. NBRC 13810]|nr:hypothetical protein Misp01_54220 [Microtetraspora sp. NBRC 13810]
MAGAEVPSGVHGVSGARLRVLPGAAEWRERTIAGMPPRPRYYFLFTVFWRVLGPGEGVLRRSGAGKVAGAFTRLITGGVFAAYEGPLTFPLRADPGQAVLRIRAVSEPGRVLTTAAIGRGIGRPW